MTDAELDELERVAKAATPGPWVAPGMPENVVDVWTAPLRAIDDGVAREWEHPTAITPAIRARDGAFIAAANPHTVLAIVAELRRLRAIVNDGDCSWSCAIAEAKDDGEYKRKKGE